MMDCQIDQRITTVDIRINQRKSSGRAVFDFLVNNTRIGAGRQIDLNGGRGFIIRNVDVNRAVTTFGGRVNDFINSRFAIIGFFESDAVIRAFFKMYGSNGTGFFNDNHGRISGEIRAESRIVLECGIRLSDELRQLTRLNEDVGKSADQVLARRSISQVGRIHIGQNDVVLHQQKSVAVVQSIGLLRLPNRLRLQIELFAAGAGGHLREGQRTAVRVATETPRAAFKL